MASESLNNAGFPPNGRCYDCGQLANRGRHYCSGGDSQIVGTLLANPVTAANMRRIIQDHLDSLPEAA